MQNAFFYSTENSKLKKYIEKQIAIDLSTNKLYYVTMWKIYHMLKDKKVILEK